MPSVSLLQKSPSSPVSCHATGFYPDRAAMFWTRDGEQLHHDVDHGEILPNHDGSFQMSVALNVSSFPAEHWGKYRCVFQLSGVKEDHVIVLDRAVIRSNRGKTASHGSTVTNSQQTLTTCLSVSPLKHGSQGRDTENGSRRTQHDTRRRKGPSGASDLMPS
ncbi:hypothetical protein CesoFtcFv8_020385 [Champsocephalus esox]|uniref:Ig-like domain-containing protein n=1 Tax=Champsocephalus esox TaxID=159716 RepID=A0AAN8GNL6_9TELE|nr:hypothetical protein CesoFtcFv8_020385 [Champsocephalus esox]